MASFMDRIRKLLRRKPKAGSKKSNGESTPANGAPQNPRSEPETAPHQQHQQEPLAVASDGAADSRASAQAIVPATRSGTLHIALVNQTTSSNVYAYITGSAIDRNNALFLLSADARTGYYPVNPSSTGTKLAQDTSIRLGPPGNTVNAEIPRLAGGRIWFSIGAPLVFALNPGAAPGSGPGLVEPSVFNQADPNIKTDFGFAEFTFNSSQVFANISYVDFVSIPVALTLRDTTGTTQRVAGLPPNGLTKIADGLRAQTKTDGRRWSSLIVPRADGSPLRILSPNSGKLIHPDWFLNYYAAYVDKVWDAYRYKQLTVDTQASWGEVNGQVGADGMLDYGSAGTFAKPSTADIFSCSTGPFATGSNAERNAIIPRLAAAFNRSTLLLSQETPNGTRPTQYYDTPITNHYARVVHEANIDHHGYAFPYDDVTPDNGIPQEGAAFSFSPQTLTVTVGGR